MGASLQLTHAKSPLRPLCANSQTGRIGTETRILCPPSSDGDVSNDGIIRQLTHSIVNTIFIVHISFDTRRFFRDNGCL
jgi:hypothetical protein